MTDNEKLAACVVVIFFMTLSLIAFGYHHGHMHLIKTLTNAAEIWK